MGSVLKNLKKLNKVRHSLENTREKNMSVK